MQMLKGFHLRHCWVSYFTTSLNWSVQPMPLGRACWSGPRTVGIRSWWGKPSFSPANDGGWWREWVKRLQWFVLPQWRQPGQRSGAILQQAPCRWPGRRWTSHIIGEVLILNLGFVRKWGYTQFHGLGPHFPTVFMTIWCHWGYTLISDKPILVHDMEVS